MTKLVRELFCLDKNAYLYRKPKYITCLGLIHRSIIGRQQHLHHALNKYWYHIYRRYELQLKLCHEVSVLYQAFKNHFQCTLRFTKYLPPLINPIYNPMCFRVHSFQTDTFVMHSVLPSDPMCSVVLFQVFLHRIIHEYYLYLLRTLLNFDKANRVSIPALPTC